MAQAVEPIEAVVISGPRRGEIIRLTAMVHEVSAEDLSALDSSLDQLLAAVDRLSAEVRLTTSALTGVSDAG